MAVIKLRDYQREALEALDEGRHDGKRRQLVVLPTGSGKTIVAAADIKRVVEQSGKGAIFMAHRDELIRQPAAKIPLVWDDAEIGRVKAKDNQLGKAVTVASVQTIQREKRLQQLVEAQEYSLLYIDEAHHATADSYVRIIDALVEANPDITIVGLTATPVRADGTRMSNVFSDVTYQKTMLELIQGGYLADIELQQVGFDISLDGIPKSAGDLKPSEVRRVLTEPEIMGEMVSSWKKYAHPRRTIAFAVDVEHARQLAKAFHDGGVKSAVIHGELPTEKRTARLEAFQAGKLQVLVNCMILTEGFDDIATENASPLACIMLARPTLSQSLYIQQIGRGTRLSPGKDNCLVLDFSFNSKRHHIVQLPHLFGMDAMAKMGPAKPKEETEAQEKHIPSILAAVLEANKVDITKPPPRAGFRWAKSDVGFCLSIGSNHGFMIIREADEGEKQKGYHVLHLEPPQTDFDQDKKSNPRAEEYTEHQLTSAPLDHQWAFGLAEDACRELHETRSKGRKMAKTTIIDRDAHWLTLDPTEKQLRALARVNKKPKNRGEATNMITAMLVEKIVRSRSPATKKQIGFMKWKGISYRDGITKGEASRLIGKWHEDNKKR